MKSIIKLRAITSLLVLIMILIMISLGLQIYDGAIISENNELKRETDQVKIRTEKIISHILHGADLSVRGYALTKNEKLADPLKIVLNDNDSIFREIEKLIVKHNYEKADDLHGVKREVKKYLAYSQDMIRLATADSMAKFNLILNEDRGFKVWKKYQAFYVPLFEFEDALIAESDRNYEKAVKANQVIQWILALIAIPAIIYIIRRLSYESKARVELLLSLEKNNRDYVFDPDTPLTDADSSHSLESSMKLFQQANTFVTAITEENYEVRWEGLNSDNQNKNEKNLSGKLTRMRDKLLHIREQEQRNSWINEGLTAFSQMIRTHVGNKETLSDQVIRYLCKYVNIQQGAVFVLLEEGDASYLELSACFAFDRKKYLQKRVEVGNGVIGQAYLEGGLIIMKQVPANFVQITSGLGHATPTYVAIIPLEYNGKKEGLIEIASLKVLKNHELEFLAKCGEFVASALSALTTQTKTEKLLQSSQEYAERLHAKEVAMEQSLVELADLQEKTASDKRLIAELKEQIEGKYQTEKYL